MNLKALIQPPVLIAVGVTAVTCLLQVLRPTAIERLEWITYDSRVRTALQFSPEVSTNLGFAYISDVTIQRVHDGLLERSYGLYWPRHIYGRIARELTAEGANAVAFDVLFHELRSDQQPVFGLKGEIVESDDYFAQAIHQAGDVILAADNGILPAPYFRTNAYGLGDISAVKDSDGILRRVRAFRIYRKWHDVIQKIADDPDYAVNLDNAIIKKDRIVLIRKAGDEKLDPIEFKLDSQGRFDLTDFIGDKIPKGMERYSLPFTEERYWHMGIVMAAKFMRLDLDHAKVELDKGCITFNGPGGLQRVLPVEVTDTRQGKEVFFYVNWSATAMNKQLVTRPVEKLLESDFERIHGKMTNEVASPWKNKIVVVGSTATGNDLADLGPTPLEKETYLVSKHWNVANSFLTGRFIRRAGLPVELLLICVAGALSGVVTWRFRSQFATAWIILLIAAYVFAAFAVYIKFCYWLPIIMPMGGGLFMTHALMMAHLVIFEQAEKRRVRGVFSKIVSPNVVNELLSKDTLPLGGAKRSVTVLFSDIRGFTEMTDRKQQEAEDYVKRHNLTGEAAEAVYEKSARDTLATVNLYLSAIAEQVILHDGVVDKFIGDCVMAFWGAPLSNESHALSAVKASMEAQRAVYRINRDRALENKRIEEENERLVAAGEEPLPLLTNLAVGAGINTGDVTVGLMGWENHMINYTVFGREVNLASRLESVSGRSRIIISEATLSHMLNFDTDMALSCVKLEPVNVKGIKTAVNIYEVPWRTGEYAVPESEFGKPAPAKPDAQADAKSETAPGAAKA